MGDPPLINPQLSDTGRDSEIDSGGGRGGGGGAEGGGGGGGGSGGGSSDVGPSGKGPSGKGPSGKGPSGGGPSGSRPSGSGPSGAGGTGGSGTGRGGPSHVPDPARVPAPTPVPVLVPPPVSVVLVTPRPKPPPSELICTVGSFALFPYMYPPDDLCNYVFYTDVVVVKNSLYGIEADASWKQFKKHMKTYTVTQGGISFDVRYLVPQKMDHKVLQRELTNLAADNIKHYGVLKLLGRLTTLDTYMSNAIRVLEILRASQTINARIVMAIGLYDYAEPNAWERYRSEITKAVEQTKADTVIAISSTGWIENVKKCFSAPTSMFDYKRLTDPQRTAAMSYPDLNTQGYLATLRYTKNTTRLGLSLEMGTLLYVLNGTKSDIDKRAYHQCKNFYLTQLDTVDCQGYTVSTLLPGGMKIGSPQTRNDILLSWEDEDSLTDKLDALKKSGKFREGWSWLLYNVHLGDISKRCSVDPFERVQFLKDRLIAPD
nr:uncharacterized protein LOC126533959 [Dermacentor andersoni]